MVVVAGKLMEIMGKKDRKKGEMFSDWEALRKHLCEDKGLDLPVRSDLAEAGESTGKKKHPHFSFLWSKFSHKPSVLPLVVLSRACF